MQRQEQKNLKEKGKIMQSKNWAWQKQREQNMANGLDDIQQGSFMHDEMLVVIKAGLKELGINPDSSILSENFNLLMKGQIKIVKEI